MARCAMGMRRLVPSVSQLLVGWRQMDASRCLRTQGPEAPGTRTAVGSGSGLCPGRRPADPTHDLNRGDPSSRDRRLNSATAKFIASH
jgi:hypothetical protein